jgi:hypothetical protein
MLELRRLEAGIQESLVFLLVMAVTYYWQYFSPQGHERHREKFIVYQKMIVWYFASKFRYLFQPKMIGSRFQGSAPPLAAETAILIEEETS